MTDIAFEPARRLASMIRRRKIGCLELLDHYLDRVDRYNPALNAIVATDIPAARKRARAADRALAKADVWGPFHGVPMTVKEALQLEGLPTTFGAPQHRDNIAKRNALAVDRWLTAGATIFGKTNVPIWLMDGQAFNDIYGATNNPWDLARTPGGSSGGSRPRSPAASRHRSGQRHRFLDPQPSPFCGIFGHKPTYDVCPPRGHHVGDRSRPTTSA